MNLTEIVTATESIYRGRVVHLRVDTVVLPTGSTAKREVVEHSGAVCMAPLTSDGNVIMVRQFRLPAGRALLEIPAGSMELGESPAECAGRELVEETGYRAERLTPLFSAYLAPGYSTELIHAFLATDLSPAYAAPDEDENLERVEIPLADVVSLIEAGEIQDSKSISALLFVARMQR